MKLTAIFDIGRTNKKFFLFDEKLSLVEKHYTQLEEDVDDDGYPCEDVHALTRWMKETLFQAQKLYKIDQLNISAHGASFVQVDKQGNPVAPLYNYLKPFPDALAATFFKHYGPKEHWQQETHSPYLGMLNSGLQLYYLKYEKPDTFKRTYYSLHLPLYCSSIFSGQYVSEYTNIGCHTGLWDYGRHAYHEWVKKEKITHQFPKIVAGNHVSIREINGQTLKVGTGLHDSSSTLIPYLFHESEPFLLISTGTWSITLNPFSNELLTSEELSRDSLSFMQIDGALVRASRLFLGHEYEYHVRELANYFQKAHDYHKHIRFNSTFFLKLRLAEEKRDTYYRFSSISWKASSIATRLSCFQSFEEAYYYLMWELVQLQYDRIELALGSSDIHRIFLDGGFAENSVFVQLLAYILKGKKLYVTNSPLGSALGAALMVINPRENQANISDYITYQLVHFEGSRKNTS